MLCCYCLSLLSHRIRQTHKRDDEHGRIQTATTITTMTTATSHKHTNKHISHSYTANRPFIRSVNDELLALLLHTRIHTIFHIGLLSSFPFFIVISPFAFKHKNNNNERSASETKNEKKRKQNQMLHTSRSWSSLSFVFSLQYFSYRSKSNL